MRRRTQLTELLQRVSAYYLLFALAAILCLSAGSVLTFLAIQNRRVDNANVALLRREAPKAAMVYLRGGSKELEKFVNELRSSQSLEYCAVVGADNRYLAHSTPEFVGQMADHPEGAWSKLGEIERVRLTRKEAGDLLEYRMALKRDKQIAGWLHVGDRKPGLTMVLREASYQAPFAVIAPLGLTCIGLVVMRRLVRPLAGVESELRRATVAPTLDGLPFNMVSGSGAAGIGWNRMVAEWNARIGNLEETNRRQEAADGPHNSRFEQILASLTDGIALTDSNGRIGYINASLSALLHSEEVEQIAAQPLKDHLARVWLLEPDNILIDEQQFDRAVETEIRAGAEDSPQLLHVSRRPVLSSDGERTGNHVWIVRDVTQQKLAEKMRTQFVDSATHELRTPLANIKAYAETLALAELVDMDKQKEFLNTINHEATRLARFVDDLLCLSSIEVGSLTADRKNTDVLRMLEEIISKVKPQMDAKKITFEAALPPKLPELQLDKDKIMATLVNLLGNATKYTPEGGTVSLRVHAAQDELRIDVVDTGVGISDADLPRVFEKFFRSDDPRVQAEEGTGLGLSLAQEVMELHGGTLTATSKLNEGATFTATLPLQG